LPTTQTASLVFDPGFVVVIHSHFQMSLTINSLEAFYFMEELGAVLLNNQVFFMFSFLQHFKSTSVTFT
jgi:hypothetical protein